MKLASFDIFDTALIRKCGRPENIFFLLAHRLYPTDEAKREDFIAWRERAESIVAPTLKGGETTIAHIYTGEALKAFGEYTPQQLIDAEKAVECENLTANPAIKTVIEKHRKEGCTICFISDMYLPSAFLEEVLRREGCLQGDERVFVSCEEGARKSTGALYDKVRGIYNPTHWEHYGDHPVSDVKRAKKKGIKAHKIETPFTEAEKAVMRSAHSCTFELSCLAGLQRAARIIHGNTPHSCIAANFVAPAYVPYVHFLIQKAAAEGTKKLYFLSRDSYILQKIANEIKDEHQAVELKYLFVSRKALLLPYMQNPTAEKFLAVQDKRTLQGQSVEKLLCSLGTSTKELKEGFSTAFAFTKITNKNEEKEFLEKIFGNESSFKPHLQQIAREKRALLNDYFAQEGLFDGEKTAMVDVGWLGTTRLMINSILHEEKQPDTLFFYYGVRRDVLPGQCGRYYTFNRAKTSRTETTFLVEEYYSASPYKTTCGYEKESGYTKPVLKGEKEYNDIICQNCKVSQWIISEMTKLPTPVLDIVRLWGNLAMTEAYKNIAHYKLQPLVQAGVSHKMNFIEFIKVIFMGARTSLYTKGSIALSAPRFYVNRLYELHEFSSNIRHRIAIRLKK